MLADFKKTLNKEDSKDKLLLLSVDHAAAKFEELQVSTRGIRKTQSYLKLA
jgi:hypothetical protein